MKRYLETDLDAITEQENDYSVELNNSMIKLLKSVSITTNDKTYTPDNIPRRNLLYPQYIESNQINNKNDSQKIAMLKQKLLSKNKSTREKVFVKNEKIDDWNFYDDKNYKKMNSENSENNKVNNLNSNYNKKDNFDPKIIKSLGIENLMQGKNLPNENINDNSNINTDKINELQNLSKMNNSNLELDLNNLESSQNNNINTKDLFFKQNILLNNYNPKNNNKIKTESLLINKNISTNNKTKSKTKFNYEQLDERTVMAHSIIVPNSQLINKNATTLNNPSLLEQNTKINILGNLDNKKKKLYVPDHHRSNINEVNSLDTKNSYKKSEIIGRLDESIINFFKQENNTNSKTITQNNKLIDFSEDIIKLEEIKKEKKKKENKGMKIFGDAVNMDDLDLHINKKQIVNENVKNNLILNGTNNVSLNITNNVSLNETNDNNFNNISQINLNASNLNLNSGMNKRSKAEELLEKMRIMQSGILDDW